MRAIVTGANSGMGKATVAALADKGYEVIMLCINECAQVLFSLSPCFKSKTFPFVSFHVPLTFVWTYFNAGVI